MIIFVHFQIEERCANLIPSDEQYREVCNRLLAEIERGLNKDTNPQATVKCFPTYVRELPNGEGTYSH
jgi:hexokinase